MGDVFWSSSKISESKITVDAETFVSSGEQWCEKLKILPIEGLLGDRFEGASVFSPTATSRVLAQAAVAEIGEGKRVLDLGCGSGVVGLHLALASELKIHLSMSDVSRSATRLAAQNAKTLKVVADIKTGSLFDPWADERFDLIVSDVSGVIPEIGEALGWFRGVPNASGSDGVGLASKVIRQAPGHLSRDGALMFPIISLSNERRLVQEMSLIFTVVRKITEVALPLGLSLDDSRKMEKAFPRIRTASIGGIPVFYATVVKCEGMKEEL